MEKRIMILGRPGSGKTTFALKMKEKINIPLFHLDKYFFLPHWKKKNSNECIHIVNEIVKKNNQWILEGNNAETLDLRYKNSDLCIYIDMPRIICLYRIIKRYFFKDKNIDDRAEGCNEIITFKYLSYLWNYNKYVKKHLRSLKNKFPNTKIIFLNSDKDKQRFLENI